MCSVVEAVVPPWRACMQYLPAQSARTQYARFAPQCPGGAHSLHSLHSCGAEKGVGIGCLVLSVT